MVIYAFYFLNLDRMDTFRCNQVHFYFTCPSVAYIFSCPILLILIFLKNFNISAEHVIGSLKNMYLYPSGNDSQFYKSQVSDLVNIHKMRI